MGLRIGGHLHGLAHIRRMTYPNSDHYDGTHFFNPEPMTRQPNGRRFGLLSFLAARLRRDETQWPAWPAWVENSPHPAPNAPPPTLTFIGHSCFLIRLPGLTILTDPVFSRRCSPSQWLGPKRVRAPGLALAALPKIDLVLLSHNHYDHMDLAALRALRRHFPALVLVAPLGNAAYLAKKGLRDAVELDWWQAVEVGQSNITLTPARHFAARTLWDRNKTLWGGFFISHAGQKIYFAGDTGATKFFAEIKTRLGAPDLALLPIGAYEPRSFMAPVHINPDEAVQAFLTLGARLAVGMHFGTFHLTAEPIDAPERDLAAARTAAGIKAEDFTTLQVGETAGF